MLVFPQFVTGASALYPVTRTSVQRTVFNALADGHTDVFADPNGAAAEWELRATGMTLAEWSAIETLFLATAGMWKTFTFLDPTGNLLSDSEDFGAGAWTNGGLITLAAGEGDPFGSTRATRVTNSGLAAESMSQTLGVPGSFHYCLSVWARTSGTSAVTLTIGSFAKTFALNGTWKRISMSTNLGTSATSVTFAAQLDAGGVVDLFGMQVEAQLAASDYKMTENRGGLYAKARFGQDQLSVTAQSTDVYDAVIHIVNTEI
jgi:hypothetical protein